MKIRQAMHRLYFARSGSYPMLANDNTTGQGNSGRRPGAFADLGECGGRKQYLLHQSGLLKLSANEENMTLKLILILGLPLLLGSTECGNQEGNTRRSPSFTLTTT